MNEIQSGIEKTENPGEYKFPSEPPSIDKLIDTQKRLVHSLQIGLFKNGRSPNDIEEVNSAIAGLMMLRGED